MALYGLTMFEAKYYFEIMNKINYGSWGVDIRSKWNNSFIEVIRQQNAYMSNVKQL